MKSYSLNATEENAFKLLQENPIGRNDSVFRFVSLLGNIDESCTIAINGEWGAGKTFFIRQTKLVLDAMNLNTPMDDSLRQKIKSICSLRPDCYATVYYDAWSYDNADDPILSLVYAAIVSKQTDFSPERERSLTDIASSLVNTLTIGKVGDSVKEIAGKDRLAEFKSADRIHIMVKEFLDSLIGEHGNRLVFFIDELDRCKPDYAIRFLERIKHYFEDDRITFVFAVSLSQLQATVKNYYGAEFNASRYLDKFFDLRISLPAPRIEDFMRHRLGLSDNSRANLVCIEAAKHYNLSLRECERFVRSIKICVQPAANRASLGFGEEKAEFFAIVYILPIMLALQMTDVQTYSEFVSGNNSRPLLDILKWDNIHLDHKLLLTPNESYDDVRMAIRSDTLEKSEIPISQRLQEAYDALFSKTHRYSRETSVGQMIITDETREYLEKTVSLLAQFSNYQYE